MLLKYVNLEFFIYGNKQKQNSQYLRDKIVTYFKIPPIFFLQGDNVENKTFFLEKPIAEL